MTTDSSDYPEEPIKNVSPNEEFYSLKRNMIPVLKSARRQFRIWKDMSLDDIEPDKISAIRAAAAKLIRFADAYTSAIARMVELQITPDKEKYTNWTATRDDIFPIHNDMPGKEDGDESKIMNNDALLQAKWTFNNAFDRYYDAYEVLRNSNETLKTVCKKREEFERTGEMIVLEMETKYKAARADYIYQCMRVSDLYNAMIDARDSMMEFYITVAQFSSRGNWLDYV